MIDQLNDWNSCNPNNYTDKLPEPYRFINKILQKEILLEVFNKVFLIEKYRTDPNYEGPLRTLPPQGIFEISNITTISKNAVNQQIAAGDASGNLMILDLNKKTRVCKKEISTKKINKVVLSQRDLAVDDQKNCCIIGAVLHLDPIVYIFKYKPGENQLNQIHTIQVTKNTNTIGELPVDIEISKYSQYIYISQYNGSMIVYKIPELKIETQNQQQNTQQSTQQLLLPPISQPKQPVIKEQQKQINTQTQNNQTQEIQSTEITEIFYQIKFQGIKKEQKFDEIISSLNQVKEQNIQKEEIKDDKKKPQANATQKKQEQPQVQKEELIFENQNNYSIKSNIKDGIDLSEDYPPQRFQLQGQFILEKIGIRNGLKAFENYKQIDVVVGLMLCWTNIQKFELHYFIDPKTQSLPFYIQTQYSQKQENQSQTQQIIAKKKEVQIREVQLLYTLTCISQSKNNLYLALGLVQGSILIFDLVLQQEKFYLDKHQAQITHLDFCEDSRLVSCGYDGSVHIYNINDGTILCKRTNQFRKGTKVNYEDQKMGLWRIMNLSVSNSGIAVVQDIEGEVRLYDVWRGEKIAKLQPTQVMDDQMRKWCDKNIILQCFRNEILVSSQIISQKDNQQLQTSISLFKIFDNLVNLFPSLSNVFRKGVEKDKIMNLYEKITKQDIMNSQFEVPNLIPNQQNTLRASGLDQKQPRGSQARSKQTLKSNNNLKQSQQQNKIEQNNSNQGLNFENRPNSLIGSLHKSSHSDRYDFNSSFRSSNSPQNPHVRQNKKSINQQGLTKEMLHPEQHLLEKQQQEHTKLVYENACMIEDCRMRNSLKQLRVEKITQSLQKLGQKLAMEDEKMRLQYRYKQLQKTK